MIYPTTLKQLLELVNPDDLYEVLCFSGINDNSDQFPLHAARRRTFSNEIFEYTRQNRDIHNAIEIPITPNHLLTIVKCIQDFYLWSHHFDHVHAPPYKRVMAGLLIPLDAIKAIDRQINRGVDHGSVPPHPTLQWKTPPTEDEVAELRELAEYHGMIYALMTIQPGMSQPLAEAIMAQVETIESFDDLSDLCLADITMAIQSVYKTSFKDRPDLRDLRDRLFKLITGYDISGCDEWEDDDGDDDEGED